MIGTVTSALKAIVHVFLRDASGELQETEVFVDTGFNGNLSLSPGLIENSGFVLLDEMTAQLADGSEVSVQIHGGQIEWNGNPRFVDVIATNGDPVLGMRLLKGSELRIEVRTGGAVIIEPLA